MHHWRIREHIAQALFTLSRDFPGRQNDDNSERASETDSNDMPTRINRILLFGLILLFFVHKFHAR